MLSLRIFYTILFTTASFQMVLAQTPDSLGIKKNLTQVDSLIQSRNYGEAIPALERLITMNEASENREDLAKLFNKLSFCYLSIRNFEKGKKTAQMALGQSRKQLSYSIEEAGANDNLGDFCLLTSKYDEAVQYYQQALDIRLKTLTEYHTDIGKSHLNMASVYCSKNDFNLARDHLDKAITFLGKDTKSNQSGMGRYSFLKGQICQAERKNKQAVDWYQKAIAIYLTEAFPDRLRLAKTYGNLGTVYYLLWDYNTAIQYIEKSLKIFLEEIGEHDFGVANNYSLLARIYGRRGEHENALAYNKRTIEINRKVYGENDPSVGLAYAITGVTYSYIDDFENQLKYFEKALSIFKENFGEDHRWVVTTYENIGRVFNRLGKYDLSLEHYEKAIKTGIKVFGADNVKTAHVYLNAADTYAAIGMLERAKELYQQALTIQKREYGEKHREVAQNYVAQGDYYNSQGDYGSASAYYNKVLDMYAGEIDSTINQAFVTLEFNVLYKILGALEGKAVSSFQQYELYGKLGDLKASNQAFETADKIMERMRKTTTSYQDKITLAESNQTAPSGAISTSYLLYEAQGDPKDIEKAFYYSEKNRAASLQELLERSNAKITDGAFKALIDKVKQLKREQAGYLSKISNEMGKEPSAVEGNKIAEYEDELFVINQRQDSLKQTISDRYPAYFSVENENRLVGVDEVQALLNDKTSFVEYFFSDSITYVFVINKNDFLVKRLATPNLTNSIQKFKNGIIEKDLAIFKQSSLRLYDLLIGPISEQLMNDELIIVPHGPLWYINFELLLTHQSNSNNPKELPYLLREYAVSYANSANMLYNFPRGEINPKLECLAFSFSGADESATENALSLVALRDLGDNLPGTGKEIRAISEIVNGEYYYGTQAMEVNFKQTAGNYAIIHLALHGEVDQKHPENSKLYFAKTKDTLEDNILYSHELFTMDVPAELAVLSACNTGSGKVTMGEGVMSIGNAFQYAGTRSLVMSSWEVSDQTTPELMKLFYSNLKKGMSKSKALQHAKLDYLKNASGSRSHPFYWGSFYLVGDTTPMAFDKSFKWVYLTIILVLAFLLIRSYRWLQTRKLKS